MFVQNLGFNNGGQIICSKFTITAADLTPLGAALTGNINLLNPANGGAGAVLLPVGSLVLGCGINTTVVFTDATTAGGTLVNLVSLSCSIGNDITANTRFFGATACIMAGTALTESVGMTISAPTALTTGHRLTGNTPYAHFIAVGANLNAITFGSVDVYVYYLNCTTPLP